MDLVSLFFLLTQRSELPLELERAALVRVLLEGQVLASDGWPASGAVVVSDAGGRAVSAEDGSFRFGLELPAERSELRVTAVLGSGPSGAMGSTRIPVPPSGGVLSLGALHLARSGACQPEWLPTFGSGVGTNNPVYSLAVLDDGSGPALFVGGSFGRAGSVSGNGIAKWDGTRWSQFGSGFEAPDIPNTRVEAMAMFDNGTGPTLYVGGYLGGPESNPSYMALWNGTYWKDLGPSGYVNDYVNALVVFDDGTGPALYAGGSFTIAGGVPASYIAKWDGTTWSAVGGGMDRPVSALTVFDDGSGPALYAGGSFTTAGGVPANRIAKWEGTAWSALGNGMNNGVSALTVFDDGNGPALYAGGSFRAAGVILANRIARWDGTTWSALGSGMNGVVTALTVVDVGGGAALFATGAFTSAGGHSANYAARWDGAGWAAVGSGTNRWASALAGFDDGNGPKLYVGGSFERAGDKDVGNIASWDGVDWGPIGESPFGTNPSTWILDLALFDGGGGNGPELYAAGHIDGAGGANDIARWNGGSWAPLGGATGPSDQIEALAVFDDGGGPALYAGGRFSLTDGGTSAQNIARWNGSSWSPVGSGLDGWVLALAVFDDGGGDQLYAGGYFTLAGGSPPARIARWNGVGWSPLAGAPEFTVYALAVFDDGGGDALYTGGYAPDPGGTALDRIARWDGAAWSALGTGIEGGDSPFIVALGVFDAGSGPALYAGGRFSIAGGATVANLARWDGTAWSDVGGGVSGSSYPPLPAPLPPSEPWVDVLRVFDDGSGPALYAGGSFTCAGGVAAANLARWDGAGWAPLGSGMPGYPVNALAVHTGSTGNLALYAGGRFWGVLDSGDSYLARWQGCFDVTAPAIHPPPDKIVPEVPGSPPGEVVTFTVTAKDNKDASPSVTCTPPSGSFFPPGVTRVTCQASDAAGNVASTSFRVLVTSRGR